MNMNEWKILISAYADGETNTEETQAAQKLLAERAECRQYLGELRQISVKMQCVPDETLSPDAQHQILKKAQKESFMKTHSMVKPTAVLASVVIVFLITTQVYMKNGVQGRLKSASDDIGDQYFPGNTRDLLAEKREAKQYIAKNKRSIGGKDQYEPYYAQVDSGATREKENYKRQSVDALAYDSKTRLGNESAGYSGDKASQKLAKADKIAWDGVAYNAAAPASATFALQAIQGGDARLANASGLKAPRERQVFSKGMEAVSGKMVDQGYTVSRSVVVNNLAGDWNANGSRSYPIVQQYNQPTPSNTEEYSTITDNQFLAAQDNPLSTFSIDVDTASYSNVRRLLQNNQMPPADAVRIEEMVNYFSYNYPKPKANEPFSVTTNLAVCPWNKSHQLLHVGLKGRSLDGMNAPASQLTFLIDVSGSMASADKLPLLKDSYKMMVQQLRAQDKVAIVVYAGHAGMVLEPTPGDQKDRILAAIDNLHSGGSTAGGAGINLAYQIAKDHFIKNGNNRVILATDGDFNVGVSSTSELVRMIEDRRKEGIFLTVLGFGDGNLKDGRMQELADKGNGNYYYIDNIKEGRKVLVSELGSTLFTIAKDVKIQIEFNPGAIQSYRLIGYENRMLAKEDFNNDKKDAGEIGAGHTVTALYEIVPVGADDQTILSVDALKYQRAKAVGSNELLTLKLRYKEPNEEKSKLISKVLHRSDIKEEPTGDFAWASSVAEFGMLLRNSEFKGNSSYDHVLRTARANIGEDQFGLRQEFIDLAQRADQQSPNQLGQIQFK